MSPQRAQFTFSSQSQPASSEPCHVDRSPLLSVPCVLSLASQKFTGSTGSGLHVFLLVDIPPIHGGNVIRDSTGGPLSFSGALHTHGGNSGIREAGEGEDCHPWARRRASPRDQQEVMWHCVWGFLQERGFELAALQGPEALGLGPSFQWGQGKCVLSRPGPVPELGPECDASSCSSRPTQGETSASGSLPVQGPQTCECTGGRGRGGSYLHEQPLLGEACRERTGETMGSPALALWLK